jgi:hypothetical protein
MRNCAASLRKRVSSSCSSKLNTFFWAGAIFEDPRSAIAHRLSALNETPRL